MFNYNLYLSFLYMLMSCFMFSLLYKHLLITLISLEFMMLNLIYNLYMYLMMNQMNMFILSIFLTIIICESILGLSLLIYLVRSSGNDYLKSLKLMKW